MEKAYKIAHAKFWVWKITGLDRVLFLQVNKLGNLKIIVLRNEFDGKYIVSNLDMTFQKQFCVSFSNFVLVLFYNQNSISYTVFDLNFL